MSETNGSGMAMTSQLQLHYWPTPNGWKVTIMLEELGVPYDVNFVDIVNGDQFDPAFLTISPNNRIPALVDPHGPNGEPLSIFESGAILQYLGRKFGRFYPIDDARRSRVDQWLFWQVGGLGPMAGQAHHFRDYAPERINYAIDRYTKEVTRLYRVLERQLAGNDYLAGDYSIADIACVGWIVAHEKQGQDLRQFPRLKRWFETVMARPAVQRGIFVGRAQRERTDFARIMPFRNV